MWFESFTSARENLSLKEIKEHIKKDTENKIDKLKIEIELIDILHSDKWLIIKEWDELNYIKALTSKWNKLEWTDKKESDLIHPWDIIKIELEWIGKIVTKNWKTIWKVISGFEKRIETVEVTPIKPEKEASYKEKPKPQKKETTILQPENIPKNSPLQPENAPEVKPTKHEHIQDTKPEVLPNEVVLQYIENAFNIFKETIQKIDTPLDIKGSKEKKGQKEYLDVQFNVLIKSLNEQKNNTSPDVQNKINEIKLYLATYYADEWNIENSNFSNYKLSNELAFQVLWEINWQKSPKVPDMWDIIWSFKWIGPWKYIKIHLKKWEDISDIFENNIVKNATKEEWDKLMDQYEDNLDNYLNNAENNKDSLTKNQKQALNLLMDVNGTWFFNIKNSTTDMFDIMWWDFASIWAWIGTWAWVWTLVWWPVWFVWWAIVWWATTTIWMMLNHWDNYFSEDWKKWLTEFWINSATFWFWWAAFKWARSLQVSYWLKAALPVEMMADVTIWTTADMIRWQAYDMNIELWDAIINNLVWALLPVAFNWKQIFSAARKRLASEAAEVQQKASILSKLWDKSWAKKLIEWLSEKIGNWRNNKNVYIYRGREYIKNADWSFTNTATWRPYKWEVENLKKHKKNVEVEEKKAWSEKIKILESIGRLWKNLYEKINKWLSKSWKEKMNKSWWEDWFIKDFKENLWKKIESDYEWWKIISGTLKAPFRAWVFWIQQTWKHILKPTWEVASAINPVKMHKNLNWKQKIVWWLVTSTIYEGMTTMNTDESILDRKHLANIPINWIQLATVWFWTILSEPLVNTLYWKYEWFEQRDFIPSYFDNMYWNIIQEEMPYELWEALILDEKDILIKTIKAYEKADYTEKTIKPLRDKLLSLEELN